MKRHKLMHTGEQRYSCKTCNKHFNDASSVKIHELIHQPVAFAFIMSYEDYKNPLGFIQQSLTLASLPPQYKEQIYNMQVKHFVFVLNDASSETENKQLNTLINELKKGASYTYF